MRPQDLYLNIATFEVLLRRVLRWELMRTGGRRWLLKLGPKFDEIERQISYDKKNGNRPSTSELSYLGLRELITSLFDDLWESHFDSVFARQRSFKTHLLREITPLRNKIAHFRELDKYEYMTFEVAARCTETIRTHYSSPELTRSYLPSDPFWIKDSFDSEAEELLQTLLDKYECKELWNEYTAFECIRVHDVNPGVGIYDDHFFIELHDPNGEQLHSALADWYVKHRDSVTFVRVGHPSCRIFWSFINDPKQIQKDLRSLQKTISEAKRSKSASREIPVFSDGFAAYTQGTQFLGVAF